ncbi:hypothetical protein [Paracoccus saliphilus]|uniref:Uncharacterized protein n=1 Tax=Paracoccus saliphilus TaxID=405559 RepID=A0AA46A406_9RHOB|nr:hypothetical protein [Paracoccus saliphilus]WCR03438.1 hypothetical protein JHX88_01250 [Paracoccus saliphilus]SIS53599.1 hypothetical protein SAMN05421772_101321 [Paracoccus saliphilus]
MNRTEFIAATAVILFTAFVVGWLVGLIVQRLTRPTRASMNELDRMAQQLHEAEDARDMAVARLEEREAELMSRLAAADVDLQATMDALRISRAEIEELRDYIEKKLAPR